MLLLFLFSWKLMRPVFIVTSINISPANNHEACQLARKHTTSASLEVVSLEYDYVNVAVRLVTS